MAGQNRALSHPIVVCGRDAVLPRLRLRPVGELESRECL
jgi:hypothetical protein